MATKKYLWETEVKNEPTKTTDKKYIWETTEEETPISTTSTAKTNKTQGGTGGGRMAVAGQSKETTGKESIFGTAGSIATSAGKGFLKAAEGISDVLQYGIAGAAQLVGAKKTRDWFIDAAKMNATEQLTKTAEEYYNPIAAQGFKKDQIGSQISEGVGGVAANIGMAGAGAAAGATGNIGQYAPIFLGSTGSGISEGLNAGQSANKAVAYGLGKGIIEAGSEAAFGGIGGAFGKGALDDLLVDATTKGIKNQVVKKLTTLGIKAAGEGLEENISGALTPILQQMTIDPNATSYFKDENGKFTLKKAGQDFLIGALTSAIAQTPGVLTKTTTPEAIKPSVEQQTTQPSTITPEATQTPQEVVKTTPQNIIYRGTTDITIDGKNLKPSSTGDVGEGLYFAREKDIAKQFADSSFRSGTLEKIRKGEYVDLNTGERIYTPNEGVMEAIADNLNIKKMTSDDWNNEIEKYRDKVSNSLPPNYENVAQATFRNKGFDGIEIVNSGQANQIVIFPESINKLNYVASEQTTQPSMITPETTRATQEVAKTTQTSLIDVSKTLTNKQKWENKLDNTSGYQYLINGDMKNGNVIISKTKNGFVFNNIDLNDNLQGKGLGTEILKYLNNESVKETGKPLQSLPEYSIVGLKNHTEAGKALWESAVRKGLAIKNADNSYSMLKQPIQETIQTPQEAVKTGEQKQEIDNTGKLIPKDISNKLKNSKIRDKNGKLLEVYHGTKANFTNFDKKYIGSSNDNGWFGAGFYFTDNENMAKDFYGKGGTYKKVYLDIKNPYEATKDVINDNGTVDFAPSFKEDFKNRFPETKNIDKITSKQITDILQKNGYDGIKHGDEIVAFEPEQIIQQPIQETTIQQSEVAQPNIVPQVTTQKIQPKTKQRGVYSTALENQNIPADIKSGIKNLDKNYIVITDEDALGKAKDRITNNGYDKSLNYFETKINNNEKLSKYDIAEATLLYNDAFAKGDTKKALDILTSIAVAGTESGQVSQATSILQRSTPDGRLLGLQKQVNKINKDNENKKGFQPITIKEEDVNNIKNSQNQKELDEAVDKAMTNISEQIPKTLAYRLNEWRYFSMLANPKTHLRNMLSNLAMKGTSKIKNALSATIQDIVIKDPSQKTRTLEFANKKTREFVRQDVIDQKNRIMGENKYESSKSQIQPKQSKGSAFNSKLLKDEDWLSSSGAYKSALANYITAQKIDVDNITPIELEKARQYAIDQAEEQTFRQTSALAESISKFGRGDKISNKLVKVATDAILPFKTTPINIAKTGLEYSPVGLIKTITKNTAELKSGKITPSKYIDNLSKGLTGSGIAALGYLLADMGLLTASGSDEDKEKYFQEMQGKQPYSIQIGDKTITLDWLSPSAMPFFMGAEIAEMKKDGVDTNTLINIASALGTIIDPLTELSMLQGLNKTLQSYDKNKLGGVVTNTLQNYAMQYIPTLSGQIARTTTSERKSTTGSGTGIEKQFNTFVNQVKAKLPILINTLEPYTDQFGNKETTKIAERAFQNFLSPAYLKTVKTEKVYDEIQKLYDSTGEKSVLPASSSRYFTKNGKKIYLTPEEYTSFNTIDGQTSFKKITDFIKSYRYDNLTDQQKVDEIEKFYKASQEIAKQTYKKGK